MIEQERARSTQPRTNATHGRENALSLPIGLALVLGLVILYGMPTN